ncbi:hypothetical protein AAFF_G00296660 [Aldrovandia affinis]|uniref:Uncharacterized protein n=1 Tax=Aldrovandia affinis TaxID=143900 RepID=A0AAD7SQH1_9TELE|nr:hypothetical protein AAFF_G00296660 [Aldrovandia affinis]
MQPSRGYKEAKRLLHKHYGDELRIASAYIDKALQWPQIKSEDGKALNAYAMFLVGCRNTMEDIESLEEMDNPTNLRTVVSKLPYKMKERWRAEAYNIKERRDRRAKFTDLVSYIERQAKIATDPLFGDIPDSRPTSAGKNDKERPPAKKEKRGSFATNVSTENQKIKGAGEKSANPNKKGSAFEKPCMYCQQAHTLATCNKIRKQPHKERVEFLKSRAYASVLGRAISASSAGKEQSVRNVN